MKLGLGLSLAKTPRYAIFARQIADWQQIAEKSNTLVALAQLKLSLLGWGDKLGQANWYRTSTYLSETGPADTKPNHKGDGKVREVSQVSKQEKESRFWLVGGWLVVLELQDPFSIVSQASNNFDVYFLA